MGMLIVMMCLAGSAVALILRSARAVPAGPAVGGRPAVRPAGRVGQAMLGELDHIDGWGPRWRFAAGGAGAALLLPSWGRAAAAMWAMAAAAAGAIDVYA